MSGYLFFDKTEVSEIDDILEAIENAGHAYHHTDCWNDEPEYGDRKSCVEHIFEASQKAASAIKEQEKQKQELAMIIRCLLARIKPVATPKPQVIERAEKYLKKHGLSGEVLRD